MVRLACERPAPLGRSLSPWDCTALARQLIADEVVEGISAAAVRRVLTTPQLKPWRQHTWLYPKQPRDAAFYATVAALIDLYTRPLRPDEGVLSVDEKTSLQPRPRHAPARPAQPQHIPTRHERECTRVVHFTPVHCSWMDQVEQWFSIVQRKRLRSVDFACKDHLHAKLEQFSQEWNQHAHPFNWSTQSAAKVMAATPALAA